MRIIAAALVTACFSAVAFGQNVVDSMVYDKGTEWKIYAGDGQVSAFAVQGNSIWMSIGDHVSLLNIKTGKLGSFMKLGSASANNVKSIVRDRRGSVWFATSDGVAVRKGNSFTNYTVDDGLANNQVNKLLVATDGTIWAATQNGASSFSGGTWKSYGPDAGLVGPIVTALTEDQRGALWFGTTKGISVLYQGAWQSHTMKNGLSWNSVKALGADLRKKQIWAAVGEMDINRYNGSTWQQFMDIQEGITSIMADTQSRIWFGSSTGLIKFNGDEWISDAKKLGIPAAMVSDMYRDDAGNLWFASENGVVYLKNPYPY